MAGSLDSQIAALTASVTGMKTAADGAMSLINGFKQMLADAVAAAVAAGATPVQLQSLTDLGTTLDAESTALATAVANGTPSPQAPALASKKPKA